MAKLAADADVVEAAQPQGIYVTLNEPSPARLSRRANRIIRGILLPSKMIKNEISTG
jgi:hypothetical protein